MFWKKSKKPSKESHSTAFVRQDSRTTVKTSTAQSETTSTSVRSDTIFNENTNRIAFRTITQTVTHQQEARVTETCKRYTPTPEDLAEMRAAIFHKSETTTCSNKKTAERPAIKMLTTSANNNSNSHNKPLSPPLIFNYDSPRSCSTTTTKTTSGSRKPITKIEKTDVTQTSGCTVTSYREQRNINLKGYQQPWTTMDFPAPNKHHNTERLTANNNATKNLPSYASKTWSPADTKSLKLSPPQSTFARKQFSVKRSSEGGDQIYQSPYLNRSIYSEATKVLAPPISTSSSISAKAAQNSKFNCLKSPSSLNQSNSASTPTSPALKTYNFLPSPSAVPPTIPEVSTNSKKKSKLLPGQVYIFNNEIFDNPTNEYRVGSSADVKLLRATFESFKLKVHLIENATLKKIGATAKKIEDKDFSSNSCLVIVILSHGARREAVSAKDGTYNIDDTILFPILRNRTLTDKPKIMFIQACKGAMESETLHTDSVQPQGSPDEVFKCYSTFEGYVSYRTENGSVFIQSVCEFLKLFGSVKNIKEIMEMVKLRVKQKSNGKQIPAIMSTLTQPYVFGDYV